MKTRHLTFSELLKLAHTEGKSNKKAHLDMCERCFAEYTIATALVSKSKESKEPVEIIIGDISLSSAFRNFKDMIGTPKREVIGKPDIIGVEMCVDAHGLNFQVVSGRYEVGNIKVKIYKRTKEAKQLIELKTGVTDKHGFIRMGHMWEDTNGSDYQYLISVISVLKPAQKKAFTVSPTYNLG